MTMWCCQACPLKACTVGPDILVATVFYLAGCLPNNHATYKTPHRRAIYADPVCTLCSESRGKILRILYNEGTLCFNLLLYKAKVSQQTQ